MLPPGTRVVVDTNVLVSAFVFPGGAPERVWRAGLRRAIVPVTSTALLAELSAVVVRRFHWHEDRVGQVTRHIIRASEVVVGTSGAAPGAGEPVLRDPDDDELLAVARVARATIVVTGDRDVLDHARLPDGLRALRPADLLDLLP